METRNTSRRKWNKPDMTEDVEMQSLIPAVSKQHIHIISVGKPLSPL
jgi:hypothetical protein